MVTVRARTTLLASAVTALALVLGSFLLLRILDSQLTDNGDALARSRVRDLLSVAASGEVAPGIDNLNDESVAQVVDERGVVVAASPNAAGRPALADPELSPGTLEVFTVDGPDDDETERYRVWAGVGPTADGQVTVLVGTSLESVSEATRTLRRALLVGVPLLLILVAGAIWIFVGRALSRIDAISSAVDAIGESELDHRVPLTGVDDEVGRLARTMNRMLERLERSQQRQREFVADASHDLQSPLAALRAEAEVALLHPERYDVAALARELLGSTAQLEHLVADLVQLSRLDAGAPLETMLLDLDDVVLEEATRVRVSTTVAVDTSAVSAAPVWGDAAELRRLVRNLLDNAVRHARRQVHVSLLGSATQVVLEVSDDGPGVDPEDRERIFERFVRGDAARTHPGGTGLGLAIAQGIARRHGGRIEVLDADPGATFRLVLPVGRDRWAVRLLAGQAGDARGTMES
ncbi:Two component signal transduction histidine-protein kinase/phosphatase [metagenome]|uniref:histidine kinase n=1 Tax=metagenome TaxID=256318 RepID=A0A2P2BZ31_9ZZZZ